MVIAPMGFQFTVRRLSFLSMNKGEGNDRLGCPFWLGCPFATATVGLATEW
jgi:hypothetical protein